MLVVATSVVQLANGFFGTFISLRVAVEGLDFPGLVLSAYFAGFTLGALIGIKVIERIGHIRAYAAFAGLVAASASLIPNAAPSRITVLGDPPRDCWFRKRGVFVATESWLTAKAVHAHDRMPSDRVLAVSGQLILVSGVGSVLGPLIGANAMERFRCRWSTSTASPSCNMRWSG